jgi:X-Pro dipeptidyl-peptidase-like protein
MPGPLGTQASSLKRPGLTSHDHLVQVGRARPDSDRDQRCSGCNTDPCVPGERFAAEVALNDTAYAIPPGHRLRVALSTVYWPWIWPTTPRPARLAVWSSSLSQLYLPNPSTSHSSGKYRTDPTGPTRVVSFAIRTVRPCSRTTTAAPTSLCRLSELRTAPKVRTRTTSPPKTHSAQQRCHAAQCDCPARTRTSRSRYAAS